MATEKKDGYPTKPNEPGEFVVQAHWCGERENIQLHFGAEYWASTSIRKDTCPVVTLAGARETWEKQRPHWVNRQVVKAELSDCPIDGRTALPPLWPESVIKTWADWPGTVRNELRREGWSLHECRKIVKTDVWKAWRRDRAKEALNSIGDMLPETLSPEAPLGGSEEWPGVFMVVDRGEYVLGVRKPTLFEYHLSRSDLFTPGRIVIGKRVKEQS